MECMNKVKGGRETQRGVKAVARRDAWPPGGRGEAIQGRTTRRRQQGTDNGTHPQAPSARAAPLTPHPPEALALKPRLSVTSQSHPSSAVATRVSITVSAEEKEKEEEKDRG
ncbi:hypothetical protein EYF80_033896 [Liparis tanakae]|uniref:Uncharacterized protein n=1 Tax=Liparis tanakae TaxID=230148 RepID=A0A4Z2GQQ0_9TELE|nr:hypothetical protein EYF80_033896 [Liparis tanakae]